MGNMWEFYGNYMGTLNRLTTAYLSDVEGFL